MHRSREGKDALRGRQVPCDHKVLPRLPQQAAPRVHAQGFLPRQHLPSIRGRVPVSPQGVWIGVVV